MKPKINKSIVQDAIFVKHVFRCGKMKSPSNDAKADKKMGIIEPLNILMLPNEERFMAKYEIINDTEYEISVLIGAARIPIESTDIRHVQLTSFVSEPRVSEITGSITLPSASSKVFITVNGPRMISDGAMQESKEAPSIALPSSNITERICLGKKK